MHFCVLAAGYVLFLSMQQDAAMIFVSLQDGATKTGSVEAIDYLLEIISPFTRQPCWLKPIDDPDSYARFTETKEYKKLIKCYNSEGE